ncbi:hypothetical protein D3C77_676520 [compost metagenome]
MNTDHPIPGLDTEFAQRRLLQEPRVVDQHIQALQPGKCTFSCCGGRDITQRKTHLHAKRLQLIGQGQQRRAFLQIIENGKTALLAKS